MRKFNKISMASAAMALTLVGGGFALAASPLAAAKAPPSNIDATGGDNTSVNKQGTQGTISNSVQGVVDSDGDQDAFPLIASEKAGPQDKAVNKMTK